MREVLYIRLRDPFPGAPTAFALASESGDPSEPRPALTVRELPLSEVAALAAGRRVVAFVPGADVRLTAVSVPVRQPAKVLQAAPFMLEEQLADDLDTLHFALGRRQADGSFPVAVAALTRMNDWLAPFRDAGAVVDALVPETLALPTPGEAGWSVLPEPGQVTVRSGPYLGFGCAPEDFAMCLSLAGAEAGQALRIFVGRDDATDYTRLDRPIELAPGYGHPLEVLAGQWRESQSINLLQGAYAPRGELQSIWAPWRLAAAVAALAFAVGVATNGVQAVQLRHQAEALESRNEATFHRLFPSQTRIVDLGLQIEQQLRTLRGEGAGSGLLPLLQAAADGLGAAPGLSLREARFRDGALFLDLTGTDLQILDKLRAWYDQHPATRLEVQAADAGESGVQIRLKLTPGAAG